MQGKELALEKWTPNFFLSMKRGYSLSFFRKDVVAGLTISIVTLPLAMALAIASGAPPERGLFTAIIAGFLVSFLGGSQYQIGGPTGAFVVIVYTTIHKFGYDGMLIATFMAGVILILAGLLKAGSFIKYIPFPVITGFTSGIAVSLFCSQLNGFLGLDIASLPADFIHRWMVYFQHWNHIHWGAAALGIFSILMILGLQKTKLPLPSFLTVMVVGGFLVWFFQLPISTIGSKFAHMPSTLPWPSFPEVTWHRLVELAPSAFTIALLAAVESLLSAMIADGMVGTRHNSNVELIGQGVANIGSVFFGGISVTGAIARTITNVRAGAQTPVAGMICPVFLLLYMWLLVPVIKTIPLVSLSAVMIVVAWNMAEIQSFRYLLMGPKSDRVILLVTFCVTVFVDLTVAVQIGMVLASFSFMKRMNDVTEIQTGLSLFGDHSGENVSHVLPGVETFQINGPFFFSVASRLRDELSKIQKKPKVFILRMKHVPVMDVTAAHTLQTIALQCKKNGTLLILANVQPQPLRIIHQMGLDQLLSIENITTSTEEALERARMHLDGLKSFSPLGGA